MMTAPFPLTRDGWEAKTAIQRTVAYLHASYPGACIVQTPGIKPYLVMMHKAYLGDYATWKQAVDRIVAVSPAPEIQPMHPDIPEAWTGLITRDLASRKLEAERLKALPLDPEGHECECGATLRYDEDADETPCYECEASSLESLRDFARNPGPRTP